MKKQLDESATKIIIDGKKRSAFKSIIGKPKKEDIHVHSINLLYEAFVIVSGKYEADFYKKATHTITVNSNVGEVVFGDVILSKKKKSELSKFFTNPRNKNKIDIKLEEHIFIKEESELSFDHHGKEIKFPFKLDPKQMENYPKSILKENEKNIKRPDITYDGLVNKLKVKLKKPIESEVRDLNEKFKINKIKEVYVPIYEARVIGPKKKVGILRIDAIRKKLL